jgi:hypothetical protein
VPSSANSRACGTKKTTAKTIIQVKASPPLLATEAIVSTPTIVQIRKNRMSKRPKCFCSFCRSTSATVSGSRVVSAIGGGAPCSSRGTSSLPMMSGVLHD